MHFQLGETMATVFKGAISAGTIQAKFLSDFSNVDSDLLAMSYAQVGGGSPQVDTAAAVPGGFATVSLSPTAAGVLEVMVATGHTTDSGRLEVTRNGTAVTQGPVQDSVTWVFSVQP
jgi:hypothetical protein